jgi:hypothetical protein
MSICKVESEQDFGYEYVEEEVVEEHQNPEVKTTQDEQKDEDSSKKLKDLGQAEVKDE